MFGNGPGDALLGLTVLLQSPGQLFWYTLAFPQPSWFCCVLSFFFLSLLGTSSRPTGCGTEDILAGGPVFSFPSFLPLGLSFLSDFIVARSGPALLLREGEESAVLPLKLLDYL